MPRSTRRQVAPVRVVIRRLRGYLWTMKWVSNSIIALGAVSLLAAGLYLTLEDRTGSAATALSFGFLLVVMLLLAKFRRFKGFGFEAEMWEEKQAEAENLIERLKALSKSMVQQMAADSANIGLMNLGTTLTIRHFEENLARLRAILRQVDPDTSQDSTLFEPLVTRIVRAGGSQAAQLADQALADEIARLENAQPGETNREDSACRIAKLKELQQAHLLRRAWTSEPNYIENLLRLVGDAPLPAAESSILTRRLKVMKEELDFFSNNLAFRRTRSDPDYPWR